MQPPLPSMWEKLWWVQKHAVLLRQVKTFSLVKMELLVFSEIYKWIKTIVLSSVLYFYQCISLQCTLEQVRQTETWFSEKLFFSHIPRSPEVMWAVRERAEKRKMRAYQWRLLILVKGYLKQKSILLSVPTLFCGSSLHCCNIVKEILSNKLVYNSWETLTWVVSNLSKKLPVSRHFSCLLCCV